MDEIMFHDMHIYKHFNADKDFKWIKSGWPVSSQSDSAQSRLSVPSEEGCLIKMLINTRRMIEQNVDQYQTSDSGWPGWSIISTIGR